MGERPGSAKRGPTRTSAPLKGAADTAGRAAHKGERPLAGPAKSVDIPRKKFAIRKGDLKTPRRRQAGTREEIAVESARLSVELSERTAELEKSLEYQAATSAVLAIISRSAFDLDAVLTNIVDSATRLCHADRARIFRREGDVVRGAASSTGYDPKLSVAVDDVGLPIDRRSLIGRVALEEQIVHLPDAWNDPEASPEMSRYRRSNDARTMLGVPMKREGKLIGVIVVTRSRVEAFSQREIDLVTVFADQAVIAMENARLRAAAERARANLARYFSPNLVGLLAERDESLGPVRRGTVAVMFADIVGFTRMAESMAPESVVTLLREFHERMAEEIFACGGTIEKYIGDAIFAVFGLVNTAHDDAAQALTCANRMLHALSLWNDERARQGHTPLSVGIGLNYGPAVIGDVGSKQGLSFTVIGDTVNIASRLQSLTRELGSPLLVGDPVVTAIARDGTAGTRKLLGGLQDLGEHALRGRTAAIRVWKPVS